MAKSDNVLKVLKALAESGGIMSELVVRVTIRTNIEVDEGVLDELVRLGYLRTRLADKVVACPKCDSFSVLSKYACPKCLSIDVVKSRLLQHVICGFVGSELEYLREGERLKCPKCGMAISDESKDVKVYATFFECRLCHHKASVPEMLHVCYNCGNIFRPVDALYRGIYSYELSDAGLKLTGKG